jgi:hypothetical protein
MSTTFTSHIGTANPENKQDYMEARHRLEKSGWQLLGSGAYGAAYVHPECPETVLKIGGFSYSNHANDGWLNYIRVNAKTRSPHAPRVHAVEVYEGYYYAEIERLEHIDNDEFTGAGLRDYWYDGNIGEAIAPPMAAFLRRTERHRDRIASRNGWHYCTDVHRNNYMRRPSTGEIVLTDPWAN